MSENPFATANYLVPLDGTTHTVVANFVASATPHKIDWASFSNDNFSFFPQGAYIDNSAGTADLIIAINPIGFSLTVPAGAKQVVGWPAPKNQTCEITGNGPVEIFFVNYPLFNSAAEIDGSPTVNLAPGSVVSITGQPINTQANMQAYDVGSAAWVNALSVLPADAQAASIGLVSTSQGMEFNGAAWDRIRTPCIFNTTSANAAGSSVIWTPASGKLFRLMRYKIDVTNEAAASAASDLVLQFYDSATAMAIAETIFMPTAAGTSMGSWSSGWVDLGNGILSAVADNVLNINLSVALATGFARVTVAGTEE